jgi:hypothetical protein
MRNLIFNLWQKQNACALALILTVAFQAAGCSMSASIEDLNPDMSSVTPAKKGQFFGMTSGAIINATSANGYKVTASVGEVQSPIKMKASSGWTVYSSVEGNVVSQ